MELFGKKLDQMDYSFIEYLTNKKIEENQILEYKPGGFMADSSAKYKEERNKMMEKVCGFANTTGGFIIQGVREKDHIPIHPPEGTDIPFEDIINGHIHQKLYPKFGYSMKRILNTQNASKPIYILEIEPSIVPIMFYIKDEVAQYYIRRNDTTHVATPFDVELLFARSGSQQKLYQSAKYIFRLLTSYVSALNGPSQDTGKVDHIMRELLENRSQCAELGIVVHSDQVAHIQFTCMEGKYLISVRRSDGVKKRYPEEKLNAQDEFLIELKNYWIDNFRIYL